MLRFFEVRRLRCPTAVLAEHIEGGHEFGVVFLRFLMNSHQMIWAQPRTGPRQPHNRHADSIVRALDAKRSSRRRTFNCSLSDLIHWKPKSIIPDSIRS